MNLRYPLAGTILAAFLAACGPPGAVAPARAPRLANVPVTWHLLDSAVAATAAHGMVVSGSPIASRIGREILERGGNAADAAVAVGFALAVVHPEAGNLGGGGFAVVRTAGGEVGALDFRETAPRAATRDMYLDSAGILSDRSVIGHLASGVPGSVAGLAALHARFGSMAFRDLVEPAVALADSGFTVDDYRSASIAEAAPELQRYPASANQFLPGGEAPRPGEIWKQTDLARTLRAIADSGREAFYRGHIAELIEAEMERGGGIITRADLASYRALWRTPISATYRGYTIYSMPPPSSGGVTLAETLNILEGFDPIPPLLGADQVHLVSEAMRRAFMDRNRYLGDPDFVTMPLELLLSKDYAAGLRRGIDADRATPTPLDLPTIKEGRQTTHYSVVDAEGNAVSVTTTLNSFYGSMVTVSGAGFVLNNEMDDFTGAPGRPNQYGLIQGEANAIAPGKRMLSAMTPTVVLDSDGDLLLVLGSPGGPRIITTVAQVISNVIDHGLSLAEAVGAPRVHHQSLPDRISYERGGLLPGVRDALRSMGHELEERDPTGDVHAIMVRDGVLTGVADPRRGGGTSGY